MVTVKSVQKCYPTMHVYLSFNAFINVSNGKAIVAQYSLRRKAWDYTVRPIIKNQNI